MTNGHVCVREDELNNGFSAIKTLMEHGPAPIGASHWAHKMCQVLLLSLHQLNGFVELALEYWGSFSNLSNPEEVTQTFLGTIGNVEDVLQNWLVGFFKHLHPVIVALISWQHMQLLIWEVCAFTNVPWLLVCGKILDQKGPFLKVYH